VLAIVRVCRKELPADGLQDLPEHGLDQGEQVVCRLASQVPDSRLVQAQGVPQLLGGSPERGVDIAGRQPVNRESVDDPDRQVLVRRSGERLQDARLEHLAAVGNRFDVGNGSEGGVLPKGVPVGVVGDQPGVVGRHVGVEQTLHGVRQRLQDFALLDGRHSLEGIHVVRVHGEHADELVHPLVHVPVESGERRQVLADARLLFPGLLQQPLGHDELHVAAGDLDLLEPVLHPAEGVGDELQPRTVEDRFLHPRDEAEAEVLTDFAHLAEEVEVENQRLIGAALQIVQQLVHHE